VDGPAVGRRQDAVLNGDGAGGLGTDAWC
jgi:hypothetical protein